MSAKPPRKLRKALAISGLVVLCLIFIVVGALAAILYSETGSRFAFSRALAWYNDRIPGDAVVGSIQGCLGSRLELGGVVLKDANDRLLVEAGRLSLTWKPWDLVSGNLNVSKIFLKDTTVQVYPNSKNNPFGDLAPTSESIDDGSVNIGPDLPLRIDAELEVINFSLVSQSAGGEVQEFVRGVDFVGNVSGQGQSARLIVRDIKGRSPFLNLDVRSLSLNATWDEPTARLEGLELNSNYGDVSVAFAELDVSSLQANTKIEVRADRAFINEMYAIELNADPRIALDLEGRLDGFRAEVSLTAQDQSTLLATIEGSVSDGVDLGMKLTLSNLNPGSFSDMRPGEIAGRGQVHVKGPDFKSADIEGSFRCDKCKIWPVDQIDGEVVAHLSNGTGEIRASLLAATLDVEGRAAFEVWRPKELVWQARCEDLSVPGAVLARVMKWPLVSGSVDASGKCETSGEEQLSCDGTLSAKGLRAYGQTIDGLKIEAHGDATSVEIQAQAWRLGDHRVRTRFALILGQPLVIQLQELAAHRGNLVARLLRPAEIVVDERGFEVDALSLRVAGGRLQVKGRFSRDRESKIDIEMHELNLGHLTALFPSLEIEGTVNGHAHLEGKPYAPSGHLQANFHNLKYQNTFLKDAEVSADHRRHRLSAELSVKGGVARTVTAKASIGLRLDIKQGTAKIARDQKVDLVLDAEGIGLDAVADLFPEIKVSGRVDLHAQMNGSPARPDFTSSIQAFNLEWSGIKIGRADTDVSYQNRSAVIALVVDGDVARHIEARGTIPIQIDLINGVRWISKRHHELDIKVAGLDFDSITDMLPVLMPDFPKPVMRLNGEANIQAHLRGKLASPDLNIYADFKGLHWASRRIGDGAIRLDLKNGKGDVHAQVTQGKGRYADLKATLPLEIDLEQGSIDWQLEKEHRVALLANGVDAALIAPFVDLPDGIDFRFKGSGTGAGTFEKFLLNAKWQGDLQQEGFASLPIKGELSASREKQAAKMTIGPAAEPFMVFALDTNLSANASSEGPWDIKDKPFNARLDVPGFKLSLFSPLLPTALYGLEGTMKGQIIASGTVNNPSVQGRLVLDNGALTITALNQRLKKVGFVLSVDNTHARIDKLRFESGQGRGKGSLEMAYKEKGRLTGQGTFTLEDFPFVRPGVPEGLINSRITARIVRGPDRTDIGIKTEDTYVRLLSRTGSPVPKKVQEPTNTTFVDRRGREARNKQPNESPTPTDNRELRLAIDMNDPIEIGGSGVDMSWAGKLSLISSHGKSEARGEIRALPGRFRLLSNSFEIDSGEITLTSDGELDPFVNIVAHTTTAEAEITVTVRGRASRPELILASDPAMSQYEIISLLVTGRSDTADRGDENVQTEAASLLLAFQNPVLERQLYSRLGVDRVEVTLGQSVEEPILIVGKRLGKRWYVETEYHHNAPEDENTAGLRIVFQLSPSWSLESVYGDANKGEVGVYWRKRFDRPIQDSDTDSSSDKDKGKDKEEDKGEEH